MIYEASYGSTMMDPDLGWRPRPGYRSADLNVSAQGLRGSRIYAPIRKPGVLRIAAFGDSLVFGCAVADADCWPAIVEDRFPEIEVLNYGVLGYGLDQAYLRYKAEGRRLPRYRRDRLHAGSQRALHQRLRAVRERQRPRRPFDQAPVPFR